jgi:hypothetical protein
MTINAGRLQVSAVAKAPMAAQVRSIPRSSSSRLFGAAVLMFAALLFSSQLALAQFTQQGPKLVGTLAVGAGDQGYSVALSADGNTAIVGAPNDNGNLGAAWVYTRSSSGVWTQQGSKLVANDATFNGDGVNQGASVGLSADGNTAIVGGYGDNSYTGAAWIYTRSSNGVWTQQGNKLVANNAVGPAPSQQGWSVALSGDGNTAIVGGPSDNPNGAAWVYTRSGHAWTQQAKLIGTNAVGQAVAQGVSVALSHDGNTAIVGGPGNSPDGAAWVYTRSGHAWTQHAQLVGTGGVGGGNQGWSVALAADGNTAIVGGYGDDSNIGAAWIYSRSGTAWSQQGPKLVGTGAVGQSLQGYSVALSADGGTAIVGGYGDSSNAGAAWVFNRYRDIHHNLYWAQLGNKLVGIGVAGPYGALQGEAVAMSADGNTVIVGGYGDNSNIGAAWVFVQPLQVSPTTDIAASGTQGGPFSPSSFNYTLTATSGSVPYSIITPTWLTASPASGTVTTNKTITFKINSSADTLAPSTYSDSILFVNTSSGQAIIRAATLTVNTKLFKLTVEASPAADGTVSGGGTFAEGSSQTVTATPKTGFEFDHWTKNGTVISYSASYTFTLDANVTLVADFMKITCVECGK